MPGRKRNIRTAVVNSPLQYQFFAQDAEGDFITYSLSYPPSREVIDPSTGLLTWTSSLVGVTSLTITAELIYGPDNSIQTVKDVFGQATTYEYDQRGNILTEIDPIGTVFSFS